MRRARMLSVLSIAWMTIEAGVGIVAAVLAGSVALLGFGLDSLIELVSAGTIVWLYAGSRRGADAAERRAQQLVAGCFVALALYVTVDAVRALAGAQPGRELAGCGSHCERDHRDAATREGEGSRGQAARLRSNGRGCGAVMAVRDHGGCRPRRHPCERHAGLVVA